MNFYCSRIKHSIYIDTQGNISFCCLTKDNPSFSSYKDMLNSEYYKNLLKTQNSGNYPVECERCEFIEKSGQNSYRYYSNKKDLIYKKINQNYKIIEIQPDNICNAACFTCDSNYSSFYAKMIGKEKLSISNGIKKLHDCITNDVVQIDISGGEPLYSKSYLKILENLPNSVKWIRINTNGSIYHDFSNILIQDKILELTCSLDSIEKPFEYIRWPLKWNVVSTNFDKWINLREKFPKNFKLNVNFTISALNVKYVNKMKTWAKEKKVGLNLSFVQHVDVLDIKYQNRLTNAAKNVILDFPIAWDNNNDLELIEWLEKNDKLRKINYQDFLGE